jgi:hypothetical protein
VKNKSTKYQLNSLRQIKLDTNSKQEIFNDLMNHCDLVNKQQSKKTFKKVKQTIKKVIKKIPPNTKSLLVIFGIGAVLTTSSFIIGPVLNKPRPETEDVQGQTQSLIPTKIHNPTLKLVNPTIEPTKEITNTTQTDINSELINTNPNTNQTPLQDETEEPTDTQEDNNDSENSEDKPTPTVKPTTTITPTPIPTNTIVPTNSPFPTTTITNTPNPSPTIEPTSTPSPTPIPQINWIGEYFDNMELEGEPVLTKNTHVINYYWPTGESPDELIPDDEFSIRWTTDINTLEGTYKFSTITDDGVRIWINNELIIDEWYDQPKGGGNYSATIELDEGEHPIKIEYYEHTKNAIIQFWWNLEE